MIRRPPRSTLSSSSAASDVYKRQVYVCGQCADGDEHVHVGAVGLERPVCTYVEWPSTDELHRGGEDEKPHRTSEPREGIKRDPCKPVSYTHLRAHETPE